MEITGVFQDALTRQSNEAIRISSRPHTELMNSKNEFNHPPIARIVVDKMKFKAKHSPGSWDLNEEKVYIYLFVVKMLFNFNLMAEVFSYAVTRWFITKVYYAAITLSHKYSAINNIIDKLFENASNCT